MIVNHETVCEWMTQHGRTCYVEQIHTLQCEISEIKAEAGRYWQFCEFTMKAIKLREKEIEEIKERAYDRYYDWATD